MLDTIPCYAKYGVKRIGELDEKINRGHLGESETFEDFTRVDYVVSRKGKLERMLREIA